MSNKGILATVVALALVSVGVAGGVSVERFQSKLNTEASDARKARILEVVTERNPKAPMKAFSNFASILLAESAKHDIDYRLVLAMIDKESQFIETAVGTSGEIGLMQIMPDTAAKVVKAKGWDSTYQPPVRRKGVVVTSGASTTPSYESLGSLADPEWNLKIGIAYLRWQVERYGMTPTALRAYNRNPDHATQVRPWDSYAEKVMENFFQIALVEKLPS